MTKRDIRDICHMTENETRGMRESDDTFPSSLPDGGSAKVDVKIGVALLHAHQNVFLDFGIFHGFDVVGRIRVVVLQVARPHRLHPIHLAHQRRRLKGRRKRQRKRRKRERKRERRRKRKREREVGACAISDPPPCSHEKR